MNDLTPFVIMNCLKPGIANASEEDEITTAKDGKSRHNHVVAGHVASMSVPNHVERSLADTLVWRLSSVADVEAVFHSCDDRGVQHVYSIVEDHVPAVYKKVMRAEERIQNDFPAVAFAFHVRASQGRTPSSTAPLFARPLFER